MCGTTIAGRPLAISTDETKSAGTVDVAVLVGTALAQHQRSAYSACRDLRRSAGRCSRTTRPSISVTVGVGACAPPRDVARRPRPASALCRRPRPSPAVAQQRRHHGVHRRRLGTVSQREAFGKLQATRIAACRRRDEGFPACSWPGSRKRRLSRYGAEPNARLTAVNRAAPSPAAAAARCALLRRRALLRGMDSATRGVQDEGAARASRPIGKPSAEKRCAMYRRRASTSSTAWRISASLALEARIASSTRAARCAARPRNGARSARRSAPAGSACWPEALDHLLGGGVAPGVEHRHQQCLAVSGSASRSCRASRPSPWPARRRAPRRCHGRSAMSGGGDDPGLGGQRAARGHVAMMPCSTVWNDIPA